MFCDVRFGRGVMPKGLIADRQGYMVNGCLSYNVGEKYKPIR